MSWIERLGAILGSEVTGGRQLSGGDLGGASLIEFADGRRLVAKQGEGAGREGEMLEALRAAGAPVPELVHRSDDLLVMAYVEADVREPEGWAHLGEVLEQLHRAVSQPFGWDVDHRFGPVGIANLRSESWTEFWALNRILCHVPHVGAALASRLENLAARLGNLIPENPPVALLHGDLWGGNILFAGDRVAALIDPACYYGHREVDLAMLTLFDHPPASFFERLSLDAGWRERLPVYRLWPLLVHLRLFGNSYRDAVIRALGACGA